MIRLNCGLVCETEENRKKAIALATELVELSLRDKGCIDYDLYASTTSTDRLLIVETWENEASLKAHMESTHFRRIVPELEKAATMTLEKFTF